MVDRNSRRRGLIDRVPQTVIRPPEWTEDGRIPLWEESGIELLLRAGSHQKPSEFQERNAVILTPGEQLWQQSQETSAVNRFFLRAGHPLLLAECWQDFYIEVGKVYGFTWEHDWGRQRRGFAELCQGFFSSPATRSQFGWVSLITMQRPQYLRNWEDSRIKVTTDAVTLGTSLRFQESLLLADWHRQSGAGFAYKHLGRERDNRLRFVEFHRHLHAPAYLQRDERHIEWRYIPSIDGEHDSVLQAGRIPSMVGNGSPTDVRLGKNGYLNFAKVALPQNGRCVLLNNTLEIAPESGRVVSIRAFESTVESALLSASIVEHVTLSNVIRELLGIVKE